MLFLDGFFLWIVDVFGFFGYLDTFCYQSTSNTKVYGKHNVNNGINDMLKRAGFQNMFEDKTRYPEVIISQLSSTNCQLLLLSSEPYPFKEKHIAELQKKLPDTKIILADGEIFSWYGSRLLQAPAYFQKLHQQIKAID